MVDSVENVFKNKRILITGGYGFVGRHLIDVLTVRGAEISVIAQASERAPFSVQEYVGNLNDVGFINTCVDQSAPEIIFHLAAFKERSSAIEAFLPAIETNLIGSLNLFAAANRLKSLQSIVVVGTAEEYGHNPCPFTEDMRESPVSAYSFSKLCMTHLCEVLNILYKMPFVVVRPTLAYGPGQNIDMFLPALIKSLIDDTPFPMTPGMQTRDYVYITDLVDALIRASTYVKDGGQVFNIGSGQPVTIANLAIMVEEMLGKTGLVQVGAINYRSGEIMEYFVDNSKAKALLGWEPKVGLEEGLKNTIDFYLRGC